MKSGKKHRSRRGEAWWQELILKRERSGKRVGEICGENGVSTWSFYQWRKRLGEKRARPDFTEIEVGIVNEYEVRCRNGRSVVVRGAVTPEVLASILSVAEGEAG